MSNFIKVVFNNGECVYIDLTYVTKVILSEDKDGISLVSFVGGTHAFIRNPAKEITELIKS